MSEDDDITEWASNLTPEGGPGVMSQRMREFLGDQGYEKAVALNDAASALHIQRQTLINNLLAFATVFVVLFGVVGLFASVTLVVHMISS